MKSESAVDDLVCVVREAKLHLMYENEISILPSVSKLQGGTNEANKIDIKPERIPFHFQPTL